MATTLNPSEISDLIKTRIEKVKLAAESRNEGTVTSVSDGIVRIFGLADVMQGEMIELPNNTYALERLLELDVEEAKRESAELNIERLLKIDPRNAFANYILGTIQFARGDTVLAESSYRTCLEERQFPQAMNDLAWILQARGQYDEALSFVNKAIEVDRLAPFYWDTLGVIRMKMGQLDQAQEAFQTALGMQAGHPEIILHMAQLYERKGMKNEALKLADPLLSRPTQMSPSAYDELRALVRNLRGT